MPYVISREDIAYLVLPRLVHLYLCRDDPGPNFHRIASNIHGSLIMQLSHWCDTFCIMKLQLQPNRWVKKAKQFVDVIAEKIKLKRATRIDQTLALVKLCGSDHVSNQRK